MACGPPVRFHAYLTSRRRPATRPEGGRRGTPARERQRANALEAEPLTPLSGGGAPDRSPGGRAARMRRLADGRRFLEVLRGRLHFVELRLETTFLIDRDDQLIVQQRVLEPAPPHAAPDQN